MKPVHLNRKLMLEAPVRVADGAGGYVETWSPLGDLWANVRAGTGRERAVGSAPLSQVPYRITVRAAAYGAPSRPTADQRFREGSRVFRIVAVSDSDPEGRYLTCHSIEEIVA